MLATITSLILLAEGEAAPQPQFNIWAFLIPLMIVFTLFQLMNGPQKKEQARREQLLKNLKKNDRVSTIGGILGSVVNISADGKEVTLKVDDNTRIKFRRSAIADVFADEPVESAPKST
jgi:preprotein translocase subunit YajC